MNLNQCEHIGELISGYLDNELTQQQRQLVSVHLQSCTACMSLLKDITQQQNAIATLDYPQLEQEKLMQILNEPTANNLATAGWLCLLIGAFGIIIWHWLAMWADASVPIFFKILVTLTEIGALLLLVSVFRQRMIAKKSDRYDDVQL